MQIFLVTKLFKISVVNYTYNIVNTTDYLLPENYSFTPKVELVSSEQKAYVMITLKNVSEILKAVILPLRLKNASQFKISETDDICAVMIDPTIAHPVEFDRSTWDWRECCHEPWENGGNCTAYYMIDNDIASYWHYSWEADSPWKQLRCLRAIRFSCLIWEQCTQSPLSVISAVRI